MSTDLPIIKNSEANDILPVTTKSDDSLVRYLKEIGRFKLLTIQEEQELTQELAQTGDIEVARKIVQANLRLVVKIALEYRHAYQNIMDLIQEGNYGLMKAVSKFDPSKGAKLSYYASWWIKSYILKFLLDNFRLVKIGTTSEQKKLFYNLMKEKERLQLIGIGPDTKMLSENLGVSVKSIELMEERLSTQGSEVSLNAPLESGTELEELIANGDESIEDALAQAQGMEILKDKLQDFLKTLKDRDKDIFQQRLLSEIPPSLQAVADQYGVSRERIRQIEERLVEKLKLYMSEFIR